MDDVRKAFEECDKESRNAFPDEDGIDYASFGTGYEAGRASLQTELEAANDGLTAAYMAGSAAQTELDRAELEAVKRERDELAKKVKNREAELNYLIGDPSLEALKRKERNKVRMECAGLLLSMRKKIGRDTMYKVALVDGAEAIVALMEDEDEQD